MGEGRMMQNRTSHCKGCGADITWVKTASGKMTPVDPDGTPHWSTCPKAKDFKKTKATAPEGAQG